MTSSDNTEPHKLPSRRAAFGCLGTGLSISAIASTPSRAQSAKHGPEKPAAEPFEGDKPKELSPEEKMARRFPQPVKISYLVGLPMIDERNETLGHVRQVVRNGAGKIRLVIDYGGLFGIGSRLIAVPVEVCAMLGRQVAAADMPRDAFEPAPTWYGSGDQQLDGNKIIRVAVMRR